MTILLTLSGCIGLIGAVMLAISAYYDSMQLTIFSGILVLLFLIFNSLILFMNQKNRRP